jgi:hypothetical protein
VFTPKTGRIAALVQKFPYVKIDLDAIFGVGPANVYVDYGNVAFWANRLGWHVDIKRLKQLIDSFSGPTVTKFYYGTRPGLPLSEEIIRCATDAGYKVLTKEVKTIRLSIDVSSIPPDSPDIHPKSCV